MTKPSRHGASDAVRSDAWGEQEMFRAALDASPTGMMVVNSIGTIVLVNSQIESQFGYQRQELIGSAVELLVPSAFRTSHPNFRERFWQEPRTRPMGTGRELFGVRKDGTEIAVEIGLNPVRIFGENFVLSSVVDITERKRAESNLERQRNELERRHREKEVLLKEVHHRVKNNLQVISSLLNLQARQVTDVQSRRALRESMGRIFTIGLVHEQLYQSSDLGQIDFSEYVRYLIEHLAGALEGQGEVIVRAEVDDLLLPVDMAIPCGLIINELVTNALQHAFPSGSSGEVVIRLETRTEGFELSIADTGIGLSEKPERRGPSSLGLELVFKLAKQLRADLTVKTSPGTEFRLTVAGSFARTDAEHSELSRMLGVRPGDVLTTPIPDRK